MRPDLVCDLELNVSKPDSSEDLPGCDGLEVNTSRLPVAAVKAGE
jgi:hypothetical protein